MIFNHVLSEAIVYQGKPLDLSNTLLNFEYLGNLLCQVLVLQSIDKRKNPCPQGNLVSGEIFTPYLVYMTV